MPLVYLASLTSAERSARANLHLGASLAFVAGALNAGGFLAIGQYTSHMTGMLSAAADNLVLGELTLAITATLSIIAFTLGAASTALMVNYAKRRGDKNIYTPPLLLEALLLLAFGLIGAQLRVHELASVSAVTILLCYVMGLQNALITKISSAEIRTTHATGLITDIGIELGKLMYWNAQRTTTSRVLVLANRKKLRVHLLIVLAFFVGGVAGAAGFKHVGFSATIPLALALVILAWAPSLEPVQGHD